MSTNPEAELLATLEAARAADERRRTLGGVALTVAACGAAAGIAWVTKTIPDEQLTHALPFLPKAQEVINGVDDVFVPIGKVAIPAALGLIGATRLAARFSNAARFADDFSSKEPSHDGRGRVPRAIRRLGLPAAGTALGTFTAGIATEVSEGPNRSINAMGGVLHGETMVVQYKDAMPMVTSGINTELEARLRTEAERQGIGTHAFSLSLGSHEYDGRSFTNLIAGVETAPDSPLYWTSADGCSNLPVILDSASGMQAGETVMMNGVPAQVVGTTEGASSMNRISGLMDAEAVRTCLLQNPDAPSHGIVMETDPATAQAIVDRANADLHAPAAVIATDQYLQNSQTFWEANVQPITNVLSVAAGTMAFLAMGATMSFRLLRNRRELAAMLAAGASVSLLRFAEVVRSAKDAVTATVVGVTAAVPATIAANSLESGFKAGVGSREVLIGSALGLLGTVGGGVLSLLGLKRIANPAENTRI
jgi:hypothetical protein